MHIHAGGFPVNQSRTQEELRSNHIQLIYLKPSLFLFFELSSCFFKLVNAQKTELRSTLEEVLNDL